MTDDTTEVPIYVTAIANMRALSLSGRSIQTFVLLFVFHCALESQERNQPALTLCNLDSTIPAPSSSARLSRRKSHRTHARKQTPMNTSRNNRFILSRVSGELPPAKSASPFRASAISFRVWQAEQSSSVCRQMSANLHNSSTIYFHRPGGLLSPFNFMYTCFTIRVKVALV
jgi:hypothetical protein